MRCAPYVRVSTNKEEQKSSIENQESLFYNFIAQNGWELHDFYVDVETGTTDKRDSLKRLIADAEQKKFDCILAKELSRLARNGELSYKIRRIMEENKIHLITLDGAINTLEGNTDKFGLYAWLYEEESRRISKRIKIAFQNMATRGEFKGSIPPYGYDLKNKRLVKRNDETVEAVQLIFRLYLQGKGIESIAKEMDSRGYPTPAKVAGKRNAGQFWQGSTVKTMLQNPHYVGDLVQGRSETKSITTKSREYNSKDKWIIIPNTHEPIISREDFEAVQRLMKSRYVKRPKVKKHLFTNYVYCADCGSALWYLQNRKGYVCGRFKKHGKNACSSHVIKEDHLKRIVLEDIRSIVESSIQRDQLLQRIELGISKNVVEQQKSLRQQEKQVESLKAENRKYLKLLADDTISKEEYKEITEYNRSKVQKMEVSILELKRSISQNSSHHETMNRIATELEKVLAFEDLTEELLHRLIGRIEIGEQKQVTIQYQFADPLLFAV